MEKNDWLAAEFETTRPHLQAVAYRMLGSRSEAEDAVQEAWIRLHRSDSESIDNLGGWLTTVVARVCLDMLRSRKAAREDSLEEILVDLPEYAESGMEEKLLIADAVGPALLLVLDTLTAAERIAFVLHDLFDLPFDEIAPIIERTEAATRQLASRARRCVQGATMPRKDAERQQQVVAAFMQASRQGNFEALIRLLHPDVVLRADETAIKVSSANKARGAPQFAPEIIGAKAVADTLNGSAQGAQLSLVNGLAGATWGMKGKTVVAFCFAVTDGQITAIDIVMDKNALDNFDIHLIDNTSGVNA
ncbi:MAG TPA: sigma-70 family RNA polymerase sigma factor [Cellvibrio sp.]|nr:sigma-70 family RNA polymerase sigma factor [Cellvibrio sp.]